MFYRLGEKIKLGISLIYTKVFWPQARLIRLPAYIRGSNKFYYGRGLTCGYNVRISVNGKFLKVGKNCVIGDYVQIEANEEITLGDNVLVASRVYIGDANHGNYSDKLGLAQTDPSIPPNSRNIYGEPITIGSNVWIGQNVSILPGAQIGDGVIIGANSVVLGAIPANTIIAGTPAKVIKKWSNVRKKWERVNEDFANQ